MSLGPTAIALSRLEGLDGHASAVSRRLTAIDTISTRVPDIAAKAPTQ
jgi:hypothetical protein